MIEPVPLTPPAAIVDDPTTAPCYAAVDLGSNSFHLLVARMEGDRLITVDRLKEPVRLASGLDARGRLTGAALDRALACLQRFRQRLRGIAPERIRVAGTNALRQARNAETVLSLSEEALGHTIDIIAGREEARLIYLGVAHALQDDNHRRLVLDIGGGSTEIIVGTHFDPEVLESLHMGCVGFSGRHFPDGQVTAERLEAARLAALQELEPVQSLFRTAGWGVAIGASGTIQAMRDVSHGLGAGAEDGIDADGLQRIREALLARGRVDVDALPGLQPDRVPVFAGGFAILSACFEALGLERLQVSDWALREGLLYDLVGRSETGDVRERTVSRLMQRFQVDQVHARRVAATALQLFDAVAIDWHLDGAARRLLEWAARLHEIGLAISHSQYHKHGGYLLKHLDMPGFARGEQRLLAFLVRAHRRRYPEDDRRELFLEQRRSARALSVLLRLAVLLHRARSEVPLPALGVRTGEDSIRIDFPTGWLSEHPLTRMDLGEEAERLRDADMRLRTREGEAGAS
jgi:exopolyphosphatase / guanosine-5'-triphosphate,3'-diphosphate pyrophosphatase